MNEAEYRAALAEASALIKRVAQDERRLGELADAIEAYEREHFPFDEPTAAELEAFRADQAGGKT